jgi:hypothetical protein
MIVGRGQRLWSGNEIEFPAVYRGNIEMNNHRLAQQNMFFILIMLNEYLWQKIF